MLPVTSAIQSNILHLYLRAVDVYINVSHLPNMQSIPVLANCHGFFFLFDLILYVHSTIFQLCGTGLPGLNQY